MAGAVGRFARTRPGWVLGNPGRLARRAAARSSRCSEDLDAFHQHDFAGTRSGVLTRE